MAYTPTLRVQRRRPTTSTRRRGSTTRPCPTSSTTTSRRTASASTRRTPNRWIVSSRSRRSRSPRACRTNECRRRPGLARVPAAGRRPDRLGDRGGLDNFRDAYGLATAADDPDWLVRTAAAVAQAALDLRDDPSLPGRDDAGFPSDPARASATTCYALTTPCRLSRPRSAHHPGAARSRTLVAGAGRRRRAAEAFERRGCRFDQAVALATSGDPRRLPGSGRAVHRAGVRTTSSLPTGRGAHPASPARLLVDEETSAAQTTRRRPGRPRSARGARCWPCPARCAHQTAGCGPARSLSPDAAVARTSSAVASLGVGVGESEAVAVAGAGRRLSRQAPARAPAGLADPPASRIVRSVGSPTQAP